MQCTFIPIDILHPYDKVCLREGIACSIATTVISCFLHPSLKEEGILSPNYIK